MSEPTAYSAPLLGNLDRADWTRLEGWAFDPARPEQPVELELLDNGEVITSFLANQHRPDLEAAGLGDGRCAFFLSVRDGWSPLRAHVLEVRGKQDGRPLQGSPVTLQPDSELTPALRRTLAQSLHDVAVHGDAATQAASLRLLVNEADALLRARVPSDGAPMPAELAAFYARWAPLLDRPPPQIRRPPTPPPVLRRRALVVLERLGEMAHPMMRALLQALVRLEHEVNLVCATPDEVAPLQSAMAAAGIIFHGPPFTATVEEMLRRQAGLFDAVLIYRTGGMLAYGALARRYLPKARLVFCAAALESTTLERLAAADERPELLDQARLARTQETIAVWSADATVTVAAEDQAMLLSGVAQATVRLVPDEGAGVDGLLRELLRVPEA